MGAGRGRGAWGCRRRGRGDPAVRGRRGDPGRGPRRHVSDGRTLDGRVVLVTRPLEQAATLVTMLEERGATAVLAPAISVEPGDPAVLRRAAARVAAGEFEWVVLTSRAGVQALFDALPADGTVRARLAAVGDGTARALRVRGVEPHLVPRTFTTSALGEALPPGARRVLAARAAG